MEYHGLDIRPCRIELAKRVGIPKLQRQENAQDEGQLLKAQEKIGQQQLFGSRRCRRAASGSAPLSAKARRRPSHVTGLDHRQRRASYRAAAGHFIAGMIKEVRPGRWLTADCLEPCRRSWLRLAETVIGNGRDQREDS